MTEKSRKKLIYVSLVAAVIYGLANLDLDGPEKPASIAPAQEYLEPSAITALQAGGPGLTLNTDSIEALPWGNDPFRLGERKATVANSDPVAFELSGIIYSSENPMAIINSRPVKTGDMISKARVMSINRTSVTLEYRGKRVQLTVTEG